MREDEVEVLPAQGRLGNTLDLLQHPWSQVDIGRGAGRYRLPWPGELDVRQMYVEAHQVQRHGQRGDHAECDHLAEYQADQGDNGGPFHPQRDTAAPGLPARAAEGNLLGAFFADP